MIRLNLPYPNGSQGKPQQSRTYAVDVGWLTLHMYCTPLLPTQ